MCNLRRMMTRHAGDGRVVWIGLRGARRVDVASVDRVSVQGDGLEGDHSRAGKRAVTLIQAEHLPVIGALLGRGPVAAEILRRNILVAGINLAALRKDCVRLGDAVLRIEGPCPPCSRMEEYLGPGGYSAVRGHGGFYASVVSPGGLWVGAPVTRADMDQSSV